ncbi:hypothetical protein B566_EDAN017284 [Ephemera danica]|nr:hypothetical protein B566_EDAN017284 [Ephemera danica]
MEKYEVLSVAGEGSFGRVYKAKRKETKEIVAFKVIQKRGRPEKELEGLRRECEIQRHLHHPNIIQMLESFETENEIVVVSEFADRQLYELLGKADLKPQNVLLSNDGTAKLCDFGFARSMSRGTMLLTSIKGTPLYMAPELVTESPYDHNADLWSLGCIVYELLVGVPPFSTTSILHLVHLIKHETIRFPDFVSPQCVLFLQGLLQKESAKRLTWPDLLQHPFLQGKVTVPKDQAMAIPPFTDALSDSQQKVKESQRQQLAEQISQHSRQPSQTVRILEEYDKRQQRKTTPDQKSGTDTLDVTREALLSPNKTPTPCTINDLKPSEHSERNYGSRKYTINTVGSDSSDCDTPVEEEREWCDPNPTQNDEWLDYLQRSMEEVMAGDLSCLLKPPLVAVATAPLSRRNASPKVIEYVACLLSIPFVIEDITSDNVATLFDTYLESKIIDLIIQGTRTLVTDRTTDQPPQLASAFTQQLCEVLGPDGGASLLHHLLGLGKRKARVVADTLAVLAQVARLQPQNASLLKNVMLARSCVVLRFLAQHYADALGQVWPIGLSQRLKNLQQDEEHPNVQQDGLLAVEVQ